ncbi:MAG: DNA repair protein RecO [Saccharofermentanales bacterium]|jgi:DNA repair protein RecO (recombination protein O)|nr:DNA repair protein RecO [Bacillota bacterium]
MRHQSFKAFVLKSVPFGQKDRLLHLFSEQQGLSVAMAYGASSSKSRLQAVTMPFVLAEYEIFYYKDRITIDAGDLIEAFLPLQQDIAKLTAAAHLSQVTIDSLVQGVAEPAAYKLWGYTLHELCHSDDPAIVAQIAAFRLISDLGYAPWLNDCICCHAEIDQRGCFSFPDSGLVCSKEQINQEACIYLSQPAIASLLYIVQADYKILFNFKISNRVRSELLSFIDLYLTEKLEKQYTRLKLMDSFETIINSDNNRD